MAAVDRNTGLPVSPYGTEQSYQQTAQTGPSTTNTTGTTTSNTTGTNATVASNYSLNTTPAARDALNSLIAQLQDRPVISAEEAAAKFPIAQAQYSRSGWIFRNPTTGLTMSQTEANLFNTQQKARQTEYVKSGGMVAGGTIEQKALAAERQKEIERGRSSQDRYSKEAAFADAKELTNYFTRVLTEQQMPSILRGAEGAGASQGTARSLLTQQAVARSSESAAKVGLDAAVAYGGINTQFAAILEELTKNDPNSIANQLIAALNTAKGIETSGVSSSVTNVNQNTTGITDQTAVTTGNTVNTNKQVGTPAVATPQAMIQASPAYTPSSAAGTGYVVANAQEPVYEQAEFIYGGGSNVIIED